MYRKDEDSQRVTNLLTFTRVSGVSNGPGTAWFFYFYFLFFLYLAICYVIPIRTLLLVPSHTSQSNVWYALQ